MIFKKTHPEAKIPYRATPFSAGADLFAVSKEWDNDNQVLSFDTGISVSIPTGHFGMIVPRSSIYKTGLTLCNSCGIIDSDYTGSIKVKFYASRPKKNYEIGDRIAQLIIVPYSHVDFIEVDDLPKTDRGDGGFGSTGG